MADKEGEKWEWQQGADGFRGKTREKSKCERILSRAIAELTPSFLLLKRYVGDGKIKEGSIE